ncbi:MAG TPA: hypothetical protein VNT75_24600 [Symbiobacteriaceae bacterium]|nr:hypothetical protein [Symbiobacteriaceae bacterium]
MEFAAVHDQCLAAWETAFRSGDISGLAPYRAPSYQGFFGHAGVTAVEPVDREESLQGVRLFSLALKGAVHRAEHRVIRMRSETEAVVTYERIIERDGAPIATFVVLQAWRKLGGAWQIFREASEHIG